MDTRKLVLFFIFAFSILMLADAWTKAQRPPVDVSATGVRADDAKGTAPAAVPVPNAPAMAPVSRNRRVRRRVSMPPIPLMP
jgi:YidC/Oxa1 family membrane protein insertase